MKVVGFPQDIPARALPAPPMKPAEETPVHEIVHLVKLPPARSRPEVVSPTSNYGVQLSDDPLHVLPARTLIRDLSHALSEPLRRLW